MLTSIFLFCAVAGGTVMVLQFVLMVIGLGGHALDIDMPDDIGHDIGGDFHGDVGGDLDGGGDFHGDTGGHLAADHHVGSSWLFGVISLRTVIAALTFFGLTGLAVESTGAGPAKQLIFGVLAGLAAMYGVYFMMRSLAKLKADGTPHIQRAVGRHATVYVTIPARQSGVGKIQINLQNRTMEYQALTSGHAITPGAKVVVTDVVTGDTVQVEPVLEAEASEERNVHV